MSHIEDALALLEPMLMRFEGFRTTVYICPAGVPTVGAGHTGPDVRLGETWDHQRCVDVLRADARRFIVGSLALCPELHGAKLCAIADFAYNLGLGALRNSTLRKRVNAGDDNAVVAELSKWVNGGGRKLPGLVRRRAAEAMLWLS